MKSHKLFIRWHWLLQPSIASRSLFMVILKEYTVKILNSARLTPVPIYDKSVKGILRAILQKLRLLTTFQKLKYFVMGRELTLGTEQKFKMYADLVNSLYPRAAEEIAISKISEKLLLEISSAIKDGRIPEKSLYQTEDRKQDHLLLLVDTWDSLVESQINENQSVLALHSLDSSNPILAQIHKEVRASFATDIGSPLVI